MSSPTHDPTRRTILKAGSLAALGAALPSVASAQVAGNSTLKLALIGCGGRGSGAVVQSLQNEGVQLVAMADAFQDRIDGVHRNLSKRYGDKKDKFDVPKERQFVGFEAYKKAIDLADVVILTTPPGFRPMQFEYAVEKGKHIFMEKPVAVDGTGIRKVLEAAKKADEKNLKVVVGLQRRYDASYRNMLEKIKEGAMGDLVSAQVYWNSGGVWVKGRDAGQSEMEYQMRNWYYFNWLCGDHIAEQHIHNIDVANWFNDSFPVRAQGMGGRQVRVGKDFGEIFDHHYVEFGYENGFTVNSQCRHQRNTLSRVTEIFSGSKGKAYTSGMRIIGSDGSKINCKAKGKNPYQFEHDELYRHIRGDIAINNAYYGAKSTLTSIMGRMATYTGKEVTWDQALNSKLDLMPKTLAWDADPGPKAGEDGLYPCAIPGQTPLV